MSYIFVDLKVYLVYLFGMNIDREEKFRFACKKNLIDTLDHVGHVLALLSYLEEKSKMPPQTDTGLYELHGKLAKSVLHVKNQLSEQSSNSEAR